MSTIHINKVNFFFSFFLLLSTHPHPHATHPCPHTNAAICMPMPLHVHPHPISKLYFFFFFSPLIHVCMHTQCIHTSTHLHANPFIHTVTHMQCTSKHKCVHLPPAHMHRSIFNSQVSTLFLCFFFFMLICVPHAMHLHANMCTRPSHSDKCFLFFVPFFFLCMPTACMPHTNSSHMRAHVHHTQVRVFIFLYADLCWFAMHACMSTHPPISLCMPTIGTFHTMPVYPMPLHDVPCIQSSYIIVDQHMYVSQFIYFLFSHY